MANKPRLKGVRSNRHDKGRGPRKRSKRKQSKRFIILDGKKERFILLKLPIEKIKSMKIPRGTG